jgi:DNA-binding NarL/FixJ family response regulator
MCGDGLFGPLSNALTSGGYDPVFLNSMQHALLRLRKYTVACLLLDHHLCCRDVISAIRHLRVASATVPIVLINVNEPADRVSALEAGADDCIQEPLSMAEVMTRMKIVIRRSGAYDGLARHPRAFAHYGFTEAECRIANRLAGGKRLDQIAAEFKVSRNTVRSQLRSIFDKTGARRQAELVSLLFTNHDSSSAA